MEIGGPVVACVADLAFKYAGEISFSMHWNTNSATLSSYGLKNSIVININIET